MTAQEAEDEIKRRESIVKSACNSGHDYWTIATNRDDTRRLIECKRCNERIVRKRRRSGKWVHDWAMTAAQFQADNQPKAIATEFVHYPIVEFWSGVTRWFKSRGFDSAEGLEWCCFQEGAYSELRWFPNFEAQQ